MRMRQPGATFTNRDMYRMIKKADKIWIKNTPICKYYIKFRIGIRSVLAWMLTWELIIKKKRGRDRLKKRLTIKPNLDAGFSGEIQPYYVGWQEIKLIKWILAALSYPALPFFFCCLLAVGKPTWRSLYRHLLGSSIYCSSTTSWW